MTVVNNLKLSLDNHDDKPMCCKGSQSGGTKSSFGRRGGQADVQVGQRDDAGQSNVSD